jgi:hypothetical protein
MKKHHFSRRKFITKMGVTVATLPLMKSALAQNTSFMNASALKASRPPTHVPHVALLMYRVGVKL